MVGGEHQAFILSAADRRLIFRLDRDDFHPLDRPDCEMKARIGGAHIFAEPQHHAALVGLDLIHAVVSNESQKQDQRNEPSPASAGRKKAFETILSALDQLIEIGRRRTSAAPRWPARPLSPGAAAAAPLPAATAILVPRHAVSPIPIGY